MLSNILTDLRHAARALRKNPGYTCTALVTFTLAIGINSAIFTLANALIFASLPVPRPERLYQISTLSPKGGQGNLSIPAFQLIEKRASVFENVFAWLGGGMENLEMNGILFAGSVDEVAGDYYSTLGIHPALGRFITPADVGLDRFTPSRVAVLGYRAWQDRYHSDPGVLGKTLSINGMPYTIIGVHPQSFPGLIREAAADATVPVTASAAVADHVYDRKNAYYTVIGRLRDGVDSRQARAQIDTLWPAIRDSTAPDLQPDRAYFLARRIQIEPAAHGISYLRERFTQPLYILFGIVALLLLLACVNLATVALARSHGRAAELSVRAALGASRWRLLRASLVESILLACAGVVPALVFAYWGSYQMAHFMWRGYVPLALSVAPSPRVLLFTTGLAVAAAVLSGLLPAWRAGQQDPAAVINPAGSRVAGGLGLSGRILVAFQIALSFAILTGALMFSRSLNQVFRRDPVFEADRLLVAQLFPRSTYHGFDNLAYFRQLLDSLRSMPGVTSAALAHDRPIGLPFKKTLYPANVTADYRLISPGFFDTLGIRLLRGRDFDLRDDATRPQIAIVSAKLARLLVPSGDAIGMRLRIGDLKGEVAIVGIAADATLDDPRVPDAPAIYVPIFQQQPDYMGWSEAILRTPGNPAGLRRALRSQIESLGREYPLLIETVGDEFDHSMLPERVLALLTTFFGAAGLLLAAVGLYGLLAYTVSRRTAEIGVRVALGASRRAILSLVLRDVAMLLGFGLTAGLAISLAGARLTATVLSGLPSRDVPALIIAAGVLISTAVLAGLVPALRADRIDPAIALRHE